MPERDGYLPGVPCWVDTSQPDPEAGAAFYRDLFGWELENVMPPESGSPYYAARLRGRDVAAVGSQPEGASGPATWNTYIWVQSADATAERVRAAGGTVLGQPFDVMDAGRMAVCADPEGAVFCLWEGKRHRGAQVVNEPGALNFNGLNTRDPEGAKAFYGSVFGWETLDMGGGALAWTLPGYGDHLEQGEPGLRERVAELGGPTGFEDVVASLNPLAPDPPGVPAHWSVTFGADDVDAIAARTVELGGQVITPPFDGPWVRMAVITDPQGATLMVNKFVPENRDLAIQADPTVIAA
jgi:uncharacterized protein